MKKSRYEQKALDIYFRFINVGKGITSSYLAKESTKVCVDSIIEHLQERVEKIHDTNDVVDLKYWNKVRQEVLKLKL